MAQCVEGDAVNSADAGDSAISTHAWRGNFDEKGTVLSLQAQFIPAPLHRFYEVVGLVAPADVAAVLRQIWDLVRDFPPQRSEYETQQQGKTRQRFKRNFPPTFKVDRYMRAMRLALHRNIVALAPMFHRFTAKYS